MKINSKLARTSLAASSLLLAAGMFPAFAADAVMEEPPAPVPELPVASWAGPYVGLSAGYGFSGRVEEPGNTIDTDGFIGGAFLGYQWENGSFVYGIEGDVNYNDMHGSSLGTEAKSRIDGSLRARLGYAVTPDILLYATGGVAAERLKISDAFGDDSQDLVGWTAGAGADFKMTEQIFGRVEYRYSDYGSADFDTGFGDRSVDSRDNRVTFGVGLRF